VFRHSKGIASMVHRRRPTQALEVALGNGLVSRDVNIGKSGLQAIEEYLELLWSFGNRIAVVNNAILGQQFVDRLALSSVPNLIKPADDQSFVIGHTTPRCCPLSYHTMAEHAAKWIPSGLPANRTNEIVNGTACPAKN